MVEGTCKTVGGSPGAKGGRSMGLELPLKWLATPVAFTCGRPAAAATACCSRDWRRRAVATSRFRFWARAWSINQVSVGSSNCSHHRDRSASAGVGRLSGSVRASPRSP